MLRALVNGLRQIIRNSQGTMNQILSEEEIKPSMAFGFLVYSRVTVMIHPTRPSFEYRPPLSPFGLTVHVL